MKGIQTARPAIFLASAIIGITLISAATSAQAAISQSPLSLTVGVSPNIIFTLDESGSMSWGYVPDSIESNVINSGTITRLYAASEYNSMYYNPNITYIAPPSFDEDGNEIKLTTSFSSAPINGFRPNAGTLDLSNDYRPTGKEYRMPLGTHQRANNPPNDFSVFQSFNTNETRTATSAAGIEFEITRSGTSKKYTYECVIKQAGPVLDATTFSCTRNSNTYTAKTPAYYYTYDDSLQSCDASKSNTDCYKLVFVKDSEKENFATWYSFYRTRALATLSATSLAFSQLSPAIRLGWQNLKLCTNLNGGDTTNCKDNSFRQYDAQHKGQFYSWLKDVYFNSGTPLPGAMKRAGEFLKSDVAWHKYPNSRVESNKNTAENTYACRPSYHILMTDGMWNETTTNPSSFQHDGDSFDLPDTKSYSEQRPYADATSNTLADLAMHYWSTDLHSLKNRVSPFFADETGSDTENYWNPKNDPATWQHMTNFIMGLGLTSSMNVSGLPWEGSTFAGEGYEALLSGTQNWPPAASGSSNNVYDLWHAAINSRGEFFSVDSPDAMVQAFEDILNRIADRKSSAARPATSSGLVIDDMATSVSYQTSYASDENWSGDLKRSSKQLVLKDGKYVLEIKEDWSAQKELPAAASRTIKIADDGGANTSKLKDFSPDNAGDSATEGTLAYYLNINPETAGESADSRWEQRIDYLRGDDSQEGTNEESFRTRTSALGDLYGSSPVVVSGPRYLESFANRLEGHLDEDGKVTGEDSYSAFMATINGTAEGSSKRSGRVYVGGNDGMLHGFNTETGIEEFAFIPTAVFNKLNKLTGKNYSHQFYVDGSPVVADVYDQDNKKWRTILVGTLRAGGKALFALDITTPGSEQLLWEFDASDIEDEEAVKPGYSFSTPTIARLHNGRWAVVTGNGYENGASDGKAALYIIDAVTGKLTRSLDVSGTEGAANGLSSPVLADYNADGIADYAYAGDLQGNLWRFDLLPTINTDADGDGVLDQTAPLSTSTLGTVTAENFKVAYDGKPMFQAKAGGSETSPAQSITAAPSLVRHPSRLGYLVIFGTGKFFETDDKEGIKTHAQSVYGIWDTKTRAEPTSAFTIQRTAGENGQLVKQKIIEELTGTYTQGGTNPARTITTNAVDWVDANGKIQRYGWYLDLAVDETQFEGEMLIEKMSTLGQTLFFQTLVPNDDPCADGASNWTYALNPFTGGRTSFHAFDLRHIDSNNAVNVVSGIKQDGEGGVTISQTPEGFEACTGLVCQKIYPDPSSIGRQSWRVVGN
ncbi:pilus assembly protein PilY [Pseudomonas sp. JL972]|uniref:pilus assembly protein n=1 Tax=Stutzerimonas degradans TaxID=2968968 RepID=UPI0012D9EB1E|nr:PilC/PilY family type IV pilus protein [Stutzerimonas degradans]MTZ14237.1 pilus assembly protein PilY [Stutzerimonas degradans]